MKRYFVVEEKLENPEIGEYISYGIRMEGGLSVSDVSLNRDAVEDLVGRMNDGELDPIHFFDVIEDFVACC